MQGLYRYYRLYQGKFSLFCIYLSKTKIFALFFLPNLFFFFIVMHGEHNNGNLVADIII